MNVRQGTYRVTWTMNVAPAFASSVDVDRLRGNLYSEIAGRTGNSASCNDASIETPERTFVQSRPHIHCSAIVVVSGQTTTQALDTAFYTALQRSGVSRISVTRLVEKTPDDGSWGYPNGYLWILSNQDINSVNRAIVTVPTGARPLNAVPNGVVDQFLTERITNSTDRARIGVQTPTVRGDIANAVSRAASSIGGSITSPTTIIVGAVIGVAGASILAAYVIRSVK